MEKSPPGTLILGSPALESRGKCVVDLMSMPALT